jgi:hypothetical protein
VGVFEIARDTVSSLSPTTGELLVEGEHFCWTLELPWLQNTPGKSCIPTGSYRVLLTLSVRFGREMPRLIGVPKRTGILIHPGNTEEDTEGCILLGDKLIRDDVLNSRIAFDRFLVWFESVGNEAQVNIRNPVLPLAMQTT